MTIKLSRNLVYQPEKKDGQTRSNLSIPEMGLSENSTAIGSLVSKNTGEFATIKIVPEINYYYV